MTDRIRVGIVGATVTQGGSGWGANAHVPALKALPRYELKAVCTAHEDTARASAAAFGAERASHRFGEMAGHPEVDLVAVCVRVPGHRELVARARHHLNAAFSAVAISSMASLARGRNLALDRKPWIWPGYDAAVTATPSASRRAR